MLRSDPSIACYDGDHNLAFVVALLVFTLCTIATPMFLFRTIRNRLLEQDAAGSSESVESAAKLTPEETDVYTAVFEQYDTDGCGRIDDEQFSCILEEREHIFTDADLQGSSPRPRQLVS
jgi:hypothetical protein